MVSSIREILEETQIYVQNFQQIDEKHKAAFARQVE